LHFRLDAKLLLNNLVRSFAYVLATTLKLLEDQQDFASTKLGKAKKADKRRRRKRNKHDPRRNDPTEVTEEAFTKARQRMPLSFWLALDRHLRSHTPASIEYEVAGHVVLYLLIRWLIVEAATKTKSNRRKKLPRRKKQSTKQTKVKSCKT
jgi:hypothetical protein